MKTTFVIVGLSILGLLLGFWVYLLLFDSPQTVDDVFVDLGFKNSPPERPLLITDIDKSDNLAIGNALNQLTVRPVAGYVITSRPTDRVRYAERGTGHIFEINFTTNIETRVVGTTIGKTTAAYFSPDGLLAVIVSETDTGTAATMITIPEVTGETSVTTDLPDNIREINVISSTTVNYLQTVGDVGVAYRFNRLTGTPSELWRTPLTDIKVWWGNKTYVVNKTAPYLKGAVYEVVGNGDLIPITDSAFAYSALRNEVTGDIVETKLDPETLNLASVVNDETDTEVAILVVPEKCAFNPKDVNNLWCGAMLPNPQNQGQGFIKNWYQGTVTSEDYLWSVNLDSQVSEIVINFVDESGLIIDLMEPKFNQDGSRLFFLNKIDGTLWLYKQDNKASLPENQVNTPVVPLNP